MLGLPVEGPLQFDPLLNFSSMNGKLLRDQFFFLVDLVGRSAASLPALVQAEIEPDGSTFRYGTKAALRRPLSGPDGT